MQGSYLTACDGQDSWLAWVWLLKGKDSNKPVMRLKEGSGWANNDVDLFEGRL